MFKKGQNEGKLPNFLCPRESVNEPLSNRENEIIFEVVIITLFTYCHKNARMDDLLCLPR